eukprot:TRINITY_DN59_c2_g2_i1.p1 TRINITY_DN59_c2_g2~~TRINITY_DN59_c2_g2_i1.p1  ORF type:complete len:161 (+),score=5.41 TRINITY_DN59_c2_g2_i1:87-569(+)
MTFVTYYRFLIIELISDCIMIFIGIYSYPYFFDILVGFIGVIGVCQVIVDLKCETIKSKFNCSYKLLNRIRVQMIICGLATLLELVPLLTSIVLLFIDFSKYDDFIVFAICQILAIVIRGINTYKAYYELKFILPNTDLDFAKNNGNNQYQQTQQIIYVT